MLNTRRAQGHSGKATTGFGVGTKLRIAFFCVSAFTIAAAVVGVFALSSIEKRQNRVIDRAIPAVIDAQNFAALTADLVAAPRTISAARSQEDLDKKADALAADSEVILAALDQFERKQFAENYVTAMRPPLERLISIITQQTTVKRAQLMYAAQQAATVSSAQSATEQIGETIKPMIVEAYSDLLDSSDQVRAAISNDEIIDNAETVELFDELTEINVYRTESLAELSFRAESIHGVIDQTALEIDPDAIQILHRSYNLDLRSLTRLALELPPSVQRDEIGRHAGQLHRISTGPDDFFALRLKYIEANAEIAELTRSSREAAEAISEQVANIVMEAETAIESATVSARESISFGQWMLIVIAIGAFGVSVIIGWTFVSNNIVRRIKRLAAATDDLVAGNLEVSVDDPGQDELSEMADALDVFRANAIQVREQAAALKKSEERFSLAVQGSSVGIWDWESISEDRAYWSPMVYSLLGYEFGEIEPGISSFKALVHPDDLDRVGEAVDAHYSLKKPYDIEMRLRHKSGTYRWFRSTGQALWNEQGEAVRMTGSISDITERHEFARLLERQAEDLRRSNAELEQFAYVASHDLQEPLRMVSSYCELLERRYADKLDDDAKDFIRFAVDGARRMQSLVRDILQLSRVGRVELKTDYVNLSALAENVVADLSEMVAEADASVRVESMPALKMDPGLMRVVLQNLIQNGIKFHADQRPVVRISGRRIGPNYEVCVSDNGIGIQPQYADRIFEIFQRLHTHAEYPGTGIGLALVKRIVQRHDGEIWLDSTAEEGSTFRFTIPYKVEKVDTEASHGRVEHLVG